MERVRNAPAEPDLTPREKQVILSSITHTQDPVRHDGLVPQRSWNRKRQRFADHGLRELRRYAIRYRLSGGHIDADGEIAIRNAGYSTSQLVRIEKFVRKGMSHVDRRRSRVRIGRHVAGAVVTALMLAWLGEMMEDPLIAAILLGIVAVTLLSFQPSRRPG